MKTTNQAIHPKMTTPEKNVSRKNSTILCQMTVTIIANAIGKLARDNINGKNKAHTTMTRQACRCVSGSSPL
jgi:hypothetical protein